MLPLAAEQPGDHWPQRLLLRLAAGGEIEGIVAWLDPAPAPAMRRWTDDARRLLVRPVRPDDSTAPGAPGMPWLLARVPRGAGGDLRLGDQRLQPIWLDVPQQGAAANAAFGAGAAASPLARTDGPEWPDPRSPREFWRWELLAERKGAAAPDSGGFDPVGSLVAEHVASLWRIGLSRLRDAGHDAAAEQARDLLTRVCTDRGRPFAGWITDPQETAALLAILLDFSIDDETLGQRAREWIETRSTLILWPESAHGAQVRLAAVNTGHEPVVIRFAWGARDDVPIAVQVEPGVLSRVTLNRPVPSPPRGGAGGGHAGGEPVDPPEQVLTATAPGESIPIVFGPRQVTVRPPAVYMPALLPPLTLAEARARTRRAVDESRRTAAEIRRQSGRWELFVECHRPAPAAPTAKASLEQAPGVEHVAGIESITLMLGPEPGIDPPRTSGARVILTVPEHGWHRLFRGENDGTLQVHRRSRPDRWYCRIVMPDSWLLPDDGPATLVALLRAHGDGGGIETFPAAALPWRPEPGRSAIDLDHWD
jgi:hypothetical protein